MTDVEDLIQRVELGEVCMSSKDLDDLQARAKLEAKKRPVDNFLWARTEALIVWVHSKTVGFSFAYTAGCARALNRYDWQAPSVKEAEKVVS